MHSVQNDNLYEVVPRNFWCINIVRCYVYGDLIEKLLKIYYTNVECLLSKYDGLLSSGNLITKNIQEFKNNRIVLNYNSNSAESIAIVSEFELYFKESLCELFQNFFSRICCTLPKRLYLFKEVFNCCLLKSIFEIKELFVPITKKIENCELIRNSLDKLSLSQNFFYFYYCQNLIFTFFKDSYRAKFRLTLRQSLLTYIDIEGIKQEIKNQNDENQNTSNFNTLKKLLNKPSSEENFRLLADIKNYSAMYSSFEMKKSISPKLNYTQKKGSNVLTLSKFSPGSICSYVPSQNYHGRFDYLDKENFNKYEIQDWFKKQEMEKILGVMEELVVNEIAKTNYCHTFAYYDCEEKLKYSEIVENVEFILG